MRSLTKDQEFDTRLMTMLEGQDPIQCHNLAEILNSDPFTTRASLLRLMKSGDVIETRKRDAILYERAHGGYSPTGGAA